MKNQFTQANVDEMIQQGIIATGQYILTDHYFITNYKDKKAVDEYLDSHGFSINGESTCYGHTPEMFTLYINRE